MYNFDEANLVNILSGCSVKKRVAFAAATAARQINNYRWYAEKYEKSKEYELQNNMNLIWESLASDTIDHNRLQAHLTEVMNLMPDDNDEWDVRHTLAEDAVSSAAYSFRALLTSAPQEAAWAARRAYEAADQASIINLRDQSTFTEFEVLSHKYVQRELGRQLRDIELLNANIDDNSVIKVKNTANCEALLTDEELANLLDSSA